MRQTRRGFSLIELIVVVAIMGVLLGIAIARLSSSGAATSQVARVIASAVNQARFEAIRINEDAWLLVEGVAGGGQGSIAVCATDTTTGAVGTVCGAGARDVVVIELAGSDLGRAQIAAPAAATITFDRRGVMRNPATTDITVTDRGGGNARVVRIAPTGRAEVL